jgi:hypothetical protein
MNARRGAILLDKQSSFLPCAITYLLLLRSFQQSLAQAVSAIRTHSLNSVFTLSFLPRELSRLDCVLSNSWIHPPLPPPKQNPSQAQEAAALSFSLPADITDDDNDGGGGGGGGSAVGGRV